MSILITGGAGFIGSHLVDRLLDDGHRVTVIDDFSTGQWSNIVHLKEHDRFKVVIGSVTEADLIDSQLPEHDLVYHLASAVGVKLVVREPVKTIESIVLGTDIVLKTCARHKRPVVLTSTSEVYGQRDTFPFREDDAMVLAPPNQFRWSYACAKALDEFLALAHNYESGLPVFIARLFNTVGPRQSEHYGMVLPAFVTQAIQGRPITVYGDGSQSRSFCDVGDVVEGLVALPNCKDAEGSIVNLGGETEISILELARLVRELCESDSPIEMIPYEVAYGAGFDDIGRRLPSLDRARALLGWEPKTPLRDTILSVARYFKGME